MGDFGVYSQSLFCFCLCFRLNPKNVHQRPTVALLCGPHVKGAQGISCGRHLSNHDVHVILFLPNFVKMLESITNELNLFSKTQGQQVSSVKGERPSGAARGNGLGWLVPAALAPSSGTAMPGWLPRGCRDSSRHPEPDRGALVLPQMFPVGADPEGLPCGALVVG